MFCRLPHVEFTWGCICMDPGILLRSCIPLRCCPKIVFLRLFQPWPGFNNALCGTGFWQWSFACYLHPPEPLVALANTDYVHCLSESSPPPLSKHTTEARAEAAAYKAIRALEPFGKQARADQRKVRAACMCLGWCLDFISACGNT